MEVDQTELKNRLLNFEKQKLNDRSPSISPLPTKATIENRLREDIGGKVSNKSNADNLYTQYSSRYRSEKR